MTLPYAFFTDGRASGIPIALWACKPKPGTLTKKFELRFAPIEGAYVACVQVSADRASVPIRPEFIRYGRTNRVGWVVRREREALGAETEIPEAREPLVDPRPDWFLRTDPVLFDIPEQKADRTLLYGLPNERYRIFWSYNRDLFDLFAGELEADPERALGAYGVSEYVMEPFGRPTPAGSLDFMDEYDHGAIPRVLFPGERRGYHAGWYFKEMFTPAIFDATPESFRALYGSEWLQWCCERIVHDDPDWPYLWSLASVIRAAEIGAPIPDLAKDLPAGGEMAKRAAEMRAYVYQCAKHGVRERDSILDALTIGSETSATRPFGGGWRNAADAIAEATGMNHPALAHQQYLDQFYFPERTKAALVAYFDMYALGFDRQQDALPIAAHAVHIREALDWVHEKQKRLLASFRHDQFMRDLALHVPAPDFAVRVELADRYHFQCANAQLPFWESADAKLSTQEDWDRLAPYLSALGEGADLLSELFEGLLNRYITAYRLQAESVETMVRYLYRYDRTLSRQRAEQSLPRCSATLNLEHDEVTGRAVVKLYRGARTTLLGEYEFLTKVVATSAGEAHAPLGVTDTQQRLLMYRRAMRRKQVREFVLAKQTLEVPHAELLSGFPKLLANTGALIKSGLAIHALVAQAKEKAYADIEPDVYLEVAEESFQAFEPITDVAQSVLVKAGMSAELS